MLRLLVIPILICFVNVASAQKAEPDSDSSIERIELPPELDRVLRDYEEGWRNRDSKSLANLFSEDGFILRPGHPPIQGRTNIEKAYSNSGGPLFLHAFSYSVSDSIGYIIGGFRMQADGADVGKYILTLAKNVDGEWEISADMDNGNRR